MTRDPVYISAATVLGPDGPLTDRGVLVQNHRIVDLLPERRRPVGVRHVALDDAVLAPGLIDLQVNGGGGVLFNDDPSPAAIDRIGRAHRASGTTAFLPTLISDTREKMLAAMKAVADAKTSRMDGVLGLHLEGPFLAPAKRGIHDAAHFGNPTASDLQALAGFSAGPLLLTVAPEKVGAEAITALCRAGVIVAAGHTAASYDEATAAIKAGVSLFTHLFNAMPQMESRNPGPIAAALESDAWCSLIADGHHVDGAMLRLALRAKADRRMIFVSDAMPTVGSGSSTFSLGGRTIRFEGGRLVGEDGTLAGAHLTMIDAVRRGIRHLGLSLWEAVQMATAGPADVLGLGQERGRLTPGAVADILVLGPDLEIRNVLTESNDGASLLPK